MLGMILDKECYYAQLVRVLISLVAMQSMWRFHKNQKQNISTITEFVTSRNLSNKVIFIFNIQYLNLSKIIYSNKIKYCFMYQMIRMFKSRNLLQKKSFIHLHVAISDHSLEINFTSSGSISSDSTLWFTLTPKIQ